MTDTDLIVHLYEHGRFADLIMFVRKRWTSRSGLYLKQQRNAVKRVKQVFEQINQCPAYRKGTKNQHWWDQQIARYCNDLGVATLINDMKATFKKQGRVGGIIYFLYSKHGAPRWEMLVLHNKEQHLQQEKEQHDQAYTDMANLLNVQVFQVPDWVNQANADLKRLVNQRKDQNLRQRWPELQVQIDRILTSLENHGFKPEPQ